MFTQVAHDAAEPPVEVALETATPVAVEEQVAYVYLFLTFVPLPNAKMPLVELPVAAPEVEFALETATPQAVEVQLA